MQYFRNSLNFFLFSFVLIASPAIYADIPQTSQFLTLTDIHFDPFVTCHKNTSSCPLIEKLQQAPAVQWKTILTVYDTQPPRYKQDTCYRLLQSVLEEFKKIAAVDHPKFILVLGDMLGHNFRDNYALFTHDTTQEGYQAFVKKTMEFLTNEMATTLSTTDVYFTVGNNDSYQDDYVADPHGLFFTDMAKLWSSEIKDKNNQAIIQQEMSAGGYYAIDIPQQAELHLIVLNSILFSNKVKGNGVEQAAQAELNWLHDQLVSVSAKHQKAIIALHIPVGVDVYATLQEKSDEIVELWQPQYTQRFLAEMKQFSPYVMTILGGHSHMDWFQILTFADSHPISVNVTPGLSPLFGNNPGFKSFSYLNRSLVIENVDTYSDSLDDTQSWHKEYNFNAVYQPDCQDCQIIDGMKLIQKTGDLAQHYKMYYSVGTSSQPITTKWLPYYWCQLSAITAADYQTCLQV
ncbi:MAG: metallophosphoesterase [Gammaproteobacteria bacterium]|nr:metallophosphoesterase [Gammaproteobacteria bacterium]